MQKRITSIKTEVRPDYNADVSYIGSFDDSPKSPLAIDHKERSPEPHVLQYFNSTNATSQEEAERDYKYMMDIDKGIVSFVSVHAVAEIQTSTYGSSWLCNTIESGGLYGITDDDEAAVKEAADEQLDELKDVLHALGFNDDEITNAIKN